MDGEHAVGCDVIKNGHHSGSCNIMHEASKSHLGNNWLHGSDTRMLLDVQKSRYLCSPPMGLR